MLLTMLLLPTRHQYEGFTKMDENRAFLVWSGAPLLKFGEHNDRAAAENEVGEAAEDSKAKVGAAKMVQPLLFCLIVATDSNVPSTAALLWAFAFAVVQAVPIFLMILEIQLNEWKRNHAATPNTRLESSIAWVWWIQLVVSTAQRMELGIAIAKGGSPFNIGLKCESQDGLAFLICHNAFAVLFSFYFVFAGLVSALDVVIRLAQ
jgi:hypothetical protein